MKRAVLAAGLAMAFLPGVAIAKKAPPPTWQVVRSSDPITGETRCVVSATDRAAGIRFTRFGAIYPVVEMNSALGLLVGVSGGGKIRLPTGDILWRVDDKPFRELKAADNPQRNQPPPAPLASVPGMTAEVMRMTAALTATSTMASGDKAREMLDEMIAGNGLIYRQQTAAPAFGLPSPVEREVGQITKDGLAPFPLDESFRAGLASCGIR